MNIGIIFPKDSEALFFKDSKRPYGGANVQLFKIAKQLSNIKGVIVKCFVVDSDYKQLSIDVNKLEIIKTFKENDFLFYKIYRLHKNLRESKVDFLLQRGLTFESCILAFYCYFFKIKYIFMFAHDIESQGRYQKNRDKCYLFPMLLNFSHKLIVQNEIEYNNLISRTNPDKLQIIKKGLDFDVYKIPVKKIKKKYDCIWIARCDKWKHPEAYISLAKRFKKNKFLMISFPSPGKEIYYKKILNEIRNIENISFFEFIPNEKIFELLSQTKIFCITSDMEGDWPMVVLEAACVGLPILSLHINYNGLINNYNGGFYCNSDEQLFHEKFNYLINNPSLVRKISQNAKRFVYENHDISKNINKLIEVMK